MSTDVLDPVEDNEVAITKKKYSSNTFMTSMNLINFIIGSGIITLPISFSNAGLGAAIIALVIGSCFAHYTMTSLVKVCEITEKYVYQELVQETLGIVGYVIITITSVLKCLFAVLSYGIVVAGNLTNIFSFIAPNVPILQNKFLLIGVSFYGIVFPLTMFRNVAFLDKMSLISIILVVYYFGVVLAMTAFVPQKIYLFPGAMQFARARIPQAVSVIAFALSCHQAIPIIYRAQKNRSVDKFTDSSNISIAFCTFVYFIIATTGYMTFPGVVDGNLFGNYCPDDKVITSARLLFSLTVILSSPLQLYTCRENMTSIIYRYTKFNWFIHTAITVVLVTIVFAVASTVTDLGLVVAISGALNGSTVIFIIPSAALYFAFKNGWKPNNLTKILSLIIFILGVILLVLGVVMTIIESGTLPRIRYWCDFIVKPPTTFPPVTINDLRYFIMEAWNF